MFNAKNGLPIFAIDSVLQFRSSALSMLFQIESSGLAKQFDTGGVPTRPAIFADQSRQSWPRLGGVGPVAGQFAHARCDRQAASRRVVYRSSCRRLRATPFQSGQGGAKWQCLMNPIGQNVIDFQGAIIRSKIVL